MLSILYERFKIWIWLLLAVLFGTGALTKSDHGKPWEVVLDAGLAFICLVMFVFLFMKKQRTKKP
jgi:hypothetical protein